MSGQTLVVANDAQDSGGVLTIHLIVILVRCSQSATVPAPEIFVAHTIQILRYSVTV